MNKLMTYVSTASGEADDLRAPDHTDSRVTAGRKRLVICIYTYMYNATVFGTNYIHYLDQLI